MLPKELADGTEMNIVLEIWEPFCTQTVMVNKVGSHSTADVSSLHPAQAMCNPGMPQRHEYTVNEAIVFSVCLRWLYKVWWIQSHEQQLHLNVCAHF